MPNDHTGSHRTDTIRLGVVMDPIESITPYKDSTLAMLLAARKRGWQVWYMQQQDLYVADGLACATRTELEVFDDNDHWFEKGETVSSPLKDLDIVLMRKDPPFDMDYIYTTYLLELAEQQGVLVSNQPASLRDLNEKFSITHFPELCPPTLISMNAEQIGEFINEHGDTVVKPLDGMGGESIFRLRSGDPNTNVILETITHRNQRQIMAQKFLPEITEGDRRVLIVAGEPMPYTLARIPAKGETRGNLAAGGTGVPMPLTDAERHIAQTVAPLLERKNLLFVGVDVIGSYMTEINITSPTCIREIDAHANLDIGSLYMDALERTLKQQQGRLC